MKRTDSITTACASSDGEHALLRVRSLVGLVPLFAADTLEQDMIDSHPGFQEADAMVYRSSARS